MSDSIISRRVSRILRGHACRYQDLPTHPPNLQLPDDDGDMAQLRELADRAFDLSPTGAGRLPVAVMSAQAAVAVANKLGCTADDVYDTVHGAWPDDAVPAMLTDWPAPVVCPVVIP